MSEAADRKVSHLDVLYFLPLLALVKSLDVHSQVNQNPLKAFQRTLFFMLFQNAAGSIFNRVDVE